MTASSGIFDSKKSPVKKTNMARSSLPLLLGTLTLSIPALGGTWGDGKWGQMYWGSNPESAPAVAPTVNAQGDGSDITFALTNLLTGQQVGWSAITHFEVTCDGLPAALVSVADPRVTGLEPSTDYTCSIVAINDRGPSPAGTFSATTDTQGGLPIWLLYQATQ